MKIELSIVVPVYNEEKNIPILYERLKNAANAITPHHELIFVNDGSKDTSFLELMKLAEQDKRVYYINFSRNFGHQIAVTAGLDYSKGEAVVIIDGDLQDPPELIPELYAKYKEGYEVVYAQRLKREGESWFKKTSAKWFYRILRKMTNINIPVDTGDFRLIDRKVVECLKQMPEQNKFLRGQIAWIGFKQTAVHFERKERIHGQTNYPFSKMLKLALDGITSFSDKPLTVIARAGLFITLISFLIILYAIFSHYVLDNTISGWASLIISALFMGGIQLIAIGVLGEYMSRINKNILNRPLYIVGKTNIEDEKK